MELKADKYFWAPIIKRYKRFFLKVKFQEREFDCYLPNTGSMATCFEEGDLALIVDETSPTRKIPYTVFFIKTKSGMVMVNTQLTNKLFHEFLNSEYNQNFNNFKINPEFKYGKSRFDFLLEKENQKILIELKNCTFKINQHSASFPDAVTLRGQKHLQELSESLKDNYQAMMIYLVARDDVDLFTLKQNIDQKYYELACAAQNRGVQFKAFKLKINLPYFYIDQEIDLYWD